MRNWTANDIKHFREQMGLTQAEFGKLIGVSRNYICYLERGERRPSKTLMLLLDCIEEKEKEKEKMKGGKKNATRSL